MAEHDEAEQRRHRRASLSWPVTIKTGDGVLQGQTVDVSEGGLLIAVDRPLPRDTPLSLAIEVDDLSHVILTKGEIVRDNATATETEPHYSYGLRFTALPEEDRRCFSGNLAPEWRQEQELAAPRPTNIRMRADNGTRQTRARLGAGGAPHKIGRRTEGRQPRHDPGGNGAAAVFRRASRRRAWSIFLLTLATLAAGGIAWTWLHFRNFHGGAGQPAATSPRTEQSPAPQPTITLQPLLVVPTHTPPKSREAPEQGSPRPSR